MIERRIPRSRASRTAARLRFGRRFAAFAASASLIVAGLTIAPGAAWATWYPSWGDVQKAKANQASAQVEVNKVAALLKSLTTRSQQAQSAATAAGVKLAAAQDALFSADQEYQALKSHADDLAAQSATASTRAGRVAAQLYRSGGSNTTTSLLFASSKTSGTDPSALLDQLGAMTKLTESTSDLWAQAQQAKNNARAASDQAKSALDTRQRMQQQAQDALLAAQQASAAAQQAVKDQTAHSDELNAMLSALKDKTAKTVVGYQMGVQARARARAEAARRAAALRARQAAYVNAQGWAVPVHGVIVSGFGARAAPCAGCSTWHEGVDLGAALDTPIHAAHSGTVVYAGWAGGYGNFIIVDDGDGMSTAYGHNIDGGIVVGVGQHVRAGQVIGHVGSTGHSTGPHLHFEVRRNGVQINPIIWMAQHGAPL